MRPVLNLGEIVAAHARLSPDKLGTRDSRRAMTYNEWNARACKLANALLALGLKKGDRVLFARHAGTEVETDEQSVKIMAEGDILAVIE